MWLDSFEYIFRPQLLVNAIFLACFHKGIHSTSHLGRLVRAGEQKRFSSDCQGPDGILSQVVTVRRAYLWSSLKLLGKVQIWGSCLTGLDSSPCFAADTFFINDVVPLVYLSILFFSVTWTVPKDVVFATILYECAKLERTPRGKTVKQMFILKSLDDEKTDRQSNRIASLLCWYWC